MKGLPEVKPEQTMGPLGWESVHEANTWVAMIVSGFVPSAMALP